MQKPITRQQIRELQQQFKSVKLIDIRPAPEYEKMNVPGSVNMPADTIEENVSRLSPNDMIVCVCTKGLERSQNAAETFTKFGFDNVFYLEHGVVGWLTEKEENKI